MQDDKKLLLITGPNMAGKSVYIRQSALIVLLSQIGCFVPAEKAELSIVDRIFVRSGASDIITANQSTFMVEMVETAFILNNATENSLIIMDEIGRGTSTYDGISIAWAVTEYLVKHFSQTPKTLFATHYHELQKLESHFPKKIKNMQMAVKQENGEPIFLHSVIDGGASSSFGVAVAKLAGVPEEVIADAYSILHTLEKRTDADDKPHNQTQPIAPEDPDLIPEHVLIKELEQLDIYNMTPIEAMNELVKLKDKLKLTRKIVLEG